MVQTAEFIFADGPAIDPYEPSKADLRDWGTWLETVINAFVTGGSGRIYISKAQMDSDLSPPQYTMAWVIADPISVNNAGIYQKAGAPGTGSWGRASDLPFGFIIATDVGAGTPNAIKATTTLPVSQSALVWLSIFETNTGSPVTIQFNTDSVLTVKSNSGGDIVPGGLVGGTIALGIRLGSTFRLVSDQTSAAFQALIEAARNDAESFANLAMTAANTAITGATQNDLGTHTALSALSVPAGIQVAYLSGYTTVGDGGAKHIKRVASQPAGGGVRSADRFLPNGTTDSTNGGWWQINDDEVNLLQFGAKADNSTSIYSAWQDARAFLGSTGKRLHLPLSGTGIYYSNPASGSLDFRGITVSADPGVSIRGLVRFDSDASYGSDIPLKYDDGAGTTFADTFFMPRADNRRSNSKENFIRHGDLDRKAITPLDFNNSSYPPVKLTFSSGDTWSADASTTLSADSKQIALANDDQMRASFAPVMGGDEISVAFYSGNYVKAGIIRFVGGYVCFYANAAAGVLRTKLVGSAATEVTNLQWFGLADNPAWKPDKAQWTIRIHDVNTWSLLFNGMEIIRPASTPGPIIDAGFGMLGVASVAGAMSYWTRTRRKEAAGQSPMRLLIVGDSKSAPQTSSWDKYLKEAIDGSFGFRVWNIYNQAVAGSTSAQQLTALLANANLASSTHVVIDVGTNDGQGSGAEPTLDNIRSMINACNTAGISNGRIVLVATDLWYTRTESGGVGFNAGPNDGHALLRAGIRKLAGVRGCPFVDLTEVLTAIRAADILQPLVVDPLVRDNVHPTVYGAKLRADAIAKALISGSAREMKRKIATSQFSSAQFLNGWTANAVPPSYSVSEDGLVVLSGKMNKGTVAEPVTIMSLPANLRPPQSREYAARISNGAVCVVYVQPDGQVILSSFPSTVATYVSLDNIVYQLD